MAYPTIRQHAWISNAMNRTCISRRYDVLLCRSCLEGSKPRPSLIGESKDPRLGIYERHSSDGSLFDSYCSRDKQARTSV